MENGRSGRFPPQRCRSVSSASIWPWQTTASPPGRPRSSAAQHSKRPYSRDQRRTRERTRRHVYGRLCTLRSAHTACCMHYVSVNHNLYRHRTVAIILQYDSSVHQQHEQAGRAETCALNSSSCMCRALLFMFFGNASAHGMPYLNLAKFVVSGSCAEGRYCIPRTLPN